MIKLRFTDLPGSETQVVEIFRQNETREVIPADEYLSRECLNKKDIATCIDWSLNDHIPSKKRSTDESGLLEYSSMSKKSFIKTEESTFSSSSLTNSEPIDKVLLKKEELIKYPSKVFSDFKYDQGLDASIKKSVASHSIFEEDSSSETEYNTKSNVMTWQDWLQLPADEYALLCQNLTNRQQRGTSSSDEDDSNPQSSNTDSLQQSQSSKNTSDEPNRYSPQYTLQEDGETKSFTHAIQSGSLPQLVDHHNYSINPYKHPSYLPKVKLIGVKKWRDNTHTGRDRLRKRAVKKTADTGRSRKDSNRRKQLNDMNKEPYHNGQRITRSLIRIMENIIPTDNSRNNIGKFVWGYCMGWWPAIIVAAEDGGLESKVDKVCVYWTGEDLISLLNEKTQIEPFSTNLEIRLLRYLRDYESLTSDRKKACFVTLKLFSKYLHIPLMKPYIKWAEKHLMGKSHLNNLSFYPFPKKMQQRLEELKQQNIKVTEKIAQDETRVERLSKESSSSNDPEAGSSLSKKLQDNGPQSKSSGECIRKSTNEMILNSPEEKHLLPLKDQEPGIIVWGKIAGHSWWPAMIIHYHDCRKKEPNFGCQWILWYGDYQLSQVHYQNIMKFDEGIKKMQGYITQCRRETYMKAVLSACKDHCARLTFDTSNWTMDDVLAWVSSLNSNLKMRAISRPIDGPLESRYSTHMVEKLHEIKSNQEVAVERENTIINCDALNAVFAGVSETLEVLCIMCLKIYDDALQEHPFFECLICSTCVEEFKAIIFAYGDDGKCFYCTLCAGSDNVAICDNYECPRVYCTACLKYLICPTEYNEILVKDPWLCLLCDDNQDLNKNRIFKPRFDWKIRIGQLFHTKQDTSWNDAWNNDGKPKTMRVLSLFDGISTGLLVLEKLGIVVEDYYAAEIDSDAEIVSKAYFGDRIYRLGDVRNISKKIIDDIAPIDLLIGGSPCNDLSIVNPNRLGLHDPKGTGILFFDYCRIKKLIIEANKGHHLFWLYENVASMPSQYRLAINESLQCEPSLLDAADFSPQHRPRLFWGNLPSGVNFPPSDPSLDLQTVLTPNCNRHALVKKIRTVTTKVNSLKQGTFLLKPVLMNGETDSLWITELEEIFGFPKHYTDVKNLSATKRQKLIGQAWSVQTICALFLPLRYFFNTNLTLTSQAQDHSQ